MQPSPLAGHVKALGWQKLECPLHAIQQAITSALLHLGMPFVSTVVAGVEDCSFVVLPPQPPRAAPTTEEVVWQCFDDDPMKDGDMLQMAPPSPDLRVSILIFVASPSPEAQEKQKHDVRIRRTQGGQWRFQAFYAAFRKEFASRLGMPDERQLSLHSPLQHKRMAEQPAPCNGWARQGSPGLAVSQAEESAFNEMESPRRFTRTKNMGLTLAPLSNLCAAK